MAPAPRGAVSARWGERSFASAPAPAGADRCPYPAAVFTTPALRRACGEPANRGSCPCPASGYGVRSAQADRSATAPAPTDAPGCPLDSQARDEDGRLHHRSTASVRTAALEGRQGSGPRPPLHRSQHAFGQTATPLRRDGGDRTPSPQFTSGRRSRSFGERDGREGPIAAVHLTGLEST
jgi:hypothetical protein